MAANVLVDAGYLVAILTDRDAHHRWASTVVDQYPPPWTTCEAALSEAFYLVGPQGSASLAEFVRRRTVACPFHLEEHADEVVALMKRYASVPMSLADACLVRMSEIIAQPILLTTDSDFRVYRRHGRQVVPCVLPD
jgi:predicted nucleic acid-binding protein